MDWIVCGGGRRGAGVAVVVAFLSAGCGRALLVRDIGEYETIIRTYEERDGKEATIVISKSGSIIRKRRVTDNEIELLYQVDVKTHICRAGREVAPCENIKRDPDMESRINW
jgi:hypothetical protein